MTHRTLLALIVLNAFLVAGLIAMLTTPPAAQAQLARGASYTMISGSTAGRNNNDAVYIIDLSTGAIAPIFVSTANDSIEVFTGRVITADTRRGGSGGVRSR
jgi:hypothetical protein